MNDQIIIFNFRKRSLARQEKYRGQLFAAEALLRIVFISALFLGIFNFPVKADRKAQEPGR